MNRWLLAASLALGSTVASHTLAGFSTTAEPVNRDGIRAICDLPAREHLPNRGGNDRTPANPRGEAGKGLGLCVFTSVEVAARWQGVASLQGIQHWMTHRPGGGYPEKLDRMIQAYCAERKLPRPDYVQHIGGDEAFLDLAIRTDRMPCVTYAGRDGFYKDAWGRDTWIDHMVNLVHLDERTAAIVDNNRPGVWVWMTREEFLLRWRTRGNGWAVVLLDSPPPPHLPGQPTLTGQLRRLGRADQPLGLPGCVDRSADHDPTAAEGRWVPAASGGEWGYWVQGRCVARCFADGRCEAVDDRGFATGVPIAPPAPLPPGVAAGPLPPAEPYPNFGIDRSRFEETARYSISGIAVTRDEAHAALASPKLVDDSDRWHLTAVGDESFRNQVRSDLATLPAELRARLHVQTYSPGAWAVDHFRLPVGVNLRKPSPGRIAEQVGVIAPADYSAKRLAELLRCVGRPEPIPPPRPSSPNPGPPPVPPLDSPTEPPPEFAIATLLGWLVSGLLLVVSWVRRPNAV